MNDFPLMSAIVVQALGFGILYLILQQFFFGPVGAVIAQRERTERARLDDADLQRKKMISVREDYERRIAGIESEAREKIQEAMRQANAAREELLSHARHESERVVEKGKKDLQLEIQKASADLRDRVAELSLLAAGKILEKALDKDAHMAIIDDVLEGLPTS